MARKARRYFPNRGAPTRPRQDPSEHQGQVDAAARRLLEQHTPDGLRAMLADCTALMAQADQMGTLDPGPVSLARFRRARAEWEAVQRAVELAGSQERPEL